MLISNTTLRRVLGGLWLLDGLLQLQPRMFTADLISSVMTPALQAQPAPLAAGLAWIIQVTASHLVLVNLLIALVQVSIGACLLIGYRVDVALLASVVWSLVVWYAGEGLGMLLTGQASVLTGAPGAVLLYAALALTLLPRRTLIRLASVVIPNWLPREWRESDASVLTREGLRWVLAAFWLGACALQLQPAWWRPGQIARAIQAVQSPGTSSGMLVDPPLRWLAVATGGIEVPLNFTLVLACLALGIGLATTRSDARRLQLLVCGITLSLLVWWATEAFGMLLTGLATDPNTGPLLVLLALCCWPRSTQASAAARVRWPKPSSRQNIRIRVHYKRLYQRTVTRGYQRWPLHLAPEPPADASA